MVKKLNLTHKQFGRLTVLKKSILGRYKWLCLCSCGNETVVATSNLRSGGTKSCGCLHREKSAIRNIHKNKQRKLSLEGQRFGRLIVLKEVDNNKSGVIDWLCHCKCNNTIVVSTSNLRNNSTKSCGCLRRELYDKLVKFNKRVYTKETRKKMSESAKRKEFSDDHRRRISESHMGAKNSMYGKCGTLAPAWKGGISCEPYCSEWSFKEFKDMIKERDGYKCLNPDCFGNIYRLGVHHIDYDKKNCEPQNLITLCTSCNARANFDREWYESWYNAIIYRRGLSNEL